MLNERMPIDVDAAMRFAAGAARVLDRRRLASALGTGPPEAVWEALGAYRNPDGGYGWGLEPDLRSPESQPITALHAFEAFEECGVPTPHAGRLCDWLASVTYDDGGLPFVVPITEPASCAPWFTGADPTTSSLHGTVAVAAAAHRAARHDPVIADHPWLARATRYCLDQMTRAERLHAYELMFCLRLLEVVDAPEHLAKLRALLPPSGVLPVEGGLEDEALHPLDYAPEPGTPVRAAVAAEAIEADLDRIEAGQQDDGGWTVDFASFSPMAALEWRGYTTVKAVRLLVANGRLL